MSKMDYRDKLLNIITLFVLLIFLLCSLVISSCLFQILKGTLKAVKKRVIPCFQTDR